jgi:hypothetical protein
LETLWSMSRILILLGFQQVGMTYETVLPFVVQAKGFDWKLHLVQSYSDTLRPFKNHIFLILASDYQRVLRTSLVTFLIGLKVV